MYVSSPPLDKSYYQSIIAWLKIAFCKLPIQNSHNKSYLLLLLWSSCCHGSSGYFWREADCNKEARLAWEYFLCDNSSSGIMIDADCLINVSLRRWSALLSKAWCRELLVLSDKMVRLSTWTLICQILVFFSCRNSPEAHFVAQRSFYYISGGLMVFSINFLWSYKMFLLKCFFGGVKIDSNDAVVDVAYIKSRLRVDTSSDNLVSDAFDEILEIKSLNYECFRYYGDIFWNFRGDAYWGLCWAK